MSSFFDTNTVRDDDAHWDALAARVAARAATPPESAFAWVAHGRAGLVAAGLVLAAALASMALPGPAADDVAGDLAAVLAPTDDIGRRMLTLDRPPTVGMLLVGSTGGSR
jgi:hypothetical protein